MTSLIPIGAKTSELCYSRLKWLSFLFQWMSNHPDMPEVIFFYLQTMFFYLLLWTLYSDTGLAASLLRRSQDIGSLAAGPLSPANILAPSSNTSSTGNKMIIACDGTRYGKNLKVKSCRNVFGFLSKDDKQLTFAERDSGVPSDIPLPLRTLSSKNPIDASTSRIQCPTTQSAATVHVTLTHNNRRRLVLRPAA